MVAFLSQTELSRCGLKLFLNNDLGQPQDAASVRWTIYSMSGMQVSGRSLKAIKSTVGEYYAPWFTDVVGGSYRIDWEIGDYPCETSRIVSNYFFIINPDMYSICGMGESVEIGPGTFECGTQLGPDDLTLFLRNQDGLLQDAYAVFWKIVNLNGRPITQRKAATHSSVGSYYAPWLVTVTAGNYNIVWEYQQDQNSPLQSSTQTFYVLSYSSSSVFRSVCPGQSPQSCVGGVSYISSVCRRDVSMPNIVIQSCCAFSIPRTIHIPTGPLPAGGVFTSQNQYPIPNAVRKIAFYITYTRGAVGGFAIFKLLWGNGTEEIQETIWDQDIQNDDSAHATQFLFLQNLEGPIPIDDVPLTFILYATLPGGSNRVRLLAAEKGVPGSPGIIGITLTAST